MRILLIRHGDPDYDLDDLTPAGKIEAEKLADRLVNEDITHFYVSPLGRARATARPTLERLNRTAVVKDWLQEFPSVVDVNGDRFLQEAFPDTKKNPDGTFKGRICWDMLPAYWRDDPAYYGAESWRTTRLAKNSDSPAVYDRVTRGLDELLEQHGYRREGGLYRTEKGNCDTLAFICHFGITSVMLSYLWGVSPHIFMHMAVAAPTSVTEVVTEEREEGKVVFRMTRFGDVSHLYAAGIKPAFAARFCEVYENAGERH